MNWRKFLCAIPLCLLTAAAFGATSSVGLPRAPTAAKVLYVPANLDESLLTTLTSLQGLLARQGNTEQIYISNGKDAQALWLKMLEKYFGVRVVKNKSAMEVLRHFSEKVSGYVVYNDKDAAAFNAKAVQAALSNAVLLERARVGDIAAECLWRPVEGAPVSLQSKAARDGLSHALAAVQTPQIRWGLRDYLMMTKAPVFYETAACPEWLMPRTRGSGADDKPVFGWGNLEKEGGEGAVVGKFSDWGFYTIATDYTPNLSVLSGYDWPEPLRQKLDAPQAVKKQKTHLVTFLLTDGDNLAWVCNDMAAREEWFASPARKRMPIGFGFPPSIAELAAPVAAWYYENATVDPDNRNVFVAGPSGLGYFYPSRYPKDLLKTHTEKLVKMMAATDLHYVQIIDFNAFDKKDLWREYLKHPQIKGLVYLEYSPYHGAKGKIAWVEGKPVIAARASLWAGLADGSPEAVRKLIADSPRDLKKPESYTLVVVHAWSRKLADVEAFIQTLPADVTVVAPDVFFETAQAWLKP